MAILVPMIPLFVLLAALAVFFIVISRRRGDESRESNTKLLGKDRASILREANRRLSQNPRDAEALMALADVHYGDGEYDKSMKEYEILIGLCATNPILDEYDVTVKYALSALNNNREEEAYGSLLIAHAAKADGFDVNFNLGFIEFQRKNFEKAITYLSQARVLQPEHPGTLRYLGHSLFGARRYAEAATLLRKTVEMAPNDKESLFSMARSYHELGHEEQALKIFSHLRADPKLGPAAALFAGTIHLKTRQYELAVADFQIGLKHTNASSEITLELKYRLAATYIKQQSIPAALAILQEVETIAPEYKDVKELTTRYRELSSNENLRVFLIAQTSDFVTLCRKVTYGFFQEAKVKVTDVSIQRAEFADILTEITSAKAVESVLFRFMRTSGVVGELVLRDFYSRIKEVRANRGFCVAAGSFTEGAKHFVEARPVDLIEKDELTRRLGHING